MSEYQYLASLRMRLKASREVNHAQMDKGVSENAYHELVGRNKALAETIDQINAQIRSINGGDDDGESPQQPDPPKPRPTRYAQD